MPRRGYRGHRGLIRRLAAPKLRICAVMKTKGRLGWCGGRAGAEGGLVRTAGRCDRLGEVSGQARRGRSAGRGRDWGAAGRRYTRLMTSKADHHRPLPPRHSPSNPLPLIFEGPLCPPKFFSVPLLRLLAPSVRRRLLPCRVSAPPCNQGAMKLSVENYSNRSNSHVLPFFVQLCL